MVHAAASSGSSAIEQGEVAQGVGDPGAGVVAAVDGCAGEGLQPAPEHLGDEVVLRREVGVGGGRRHAGPAGHVADGEPVVAVGAQLGDGRLHQGVDTVGSSLGRAPTSPAAETDVLDMCPDTSLGG